MFKGRVRLKSEGKSKKKLGNHFVPLTHNHFEGQFKKKTENREENEKPANSYKNKYE